ncbi:MAG: M28 family peptidase [Actinobacteria bacterium]|nr:M28 family peptidase [Actinomycetota bacterium]
MATRVLLATVAVAVACSSGPVTPTGSPTTAASPVAPTVDVTTTMGPGPALSTNTGAPSPAPAFGEFDTRLAVGFAERLVAATGPRPAGSAGDIAARELLALTWATTGWHVVAEPFPLPQGGESANLVAWRGDDPRGGPHIVVGGHIDTVAGSPGANDNASGIGVLVALADELRDEDVGPLVLVAFGAEEKQPSTPREHHIGSKAYAAGYADRVTAMLSVDMIGHGSPTCLCWYRDGPATLAQELAGLADDGFHVEARGDISDHVPFAERGVPAVLLWTGRSPGYHGPGDTVELLRPGDIERTGELVLRWLRMR